MYSYCETRQSNATPRDLTENLWHSISHLELYQIWHSISHGAILNFKTKFGSLFRTVQRIFFNSTCSFSDYMYMYILHLYFSNIYVMSCSRVFFPVSQDYCRSYFLSVHWTYFLVISFLPLFVTVGLQIWFLISSLNQGCITMCITWLTFHS